MMPSPTRKLCGCDCGSVAWHLCGQSGFCLCTRVDDLSVPVQFALAVWCKLAAMCVVCDWLCINVIGCVAGWRIVFVCPRMVEECGVCTQH